jgi:hypothetical protein
MLFIQMTIVILDEVHLSLLDVQYIVERFENVSHEEVMNAHILNTSMYMEFTKTKLDHYVHHISY